MPESVGERSARRGGDRRTAQPPAANTLQRAYVACATHALERAPAGSPFIQIDRSGAIAGRMTSLLGAAASDTHFANRNTERDRVGGSCCLLPPGKELGGGSRKCRGRFASLCLPPFSMLHSPESGARAVSTLICECFSLIRDLRPINSRTSSSRANRSRLATSSSINNEQHDAFWHTYI
jgi:hypothetical protein